MSYIIFATGGTTRVPTTLRHKWLNYAFVTHTAAKNLKTVFKNCSVKSVANCLTAGVLWGEFLFAHEICRLLKVTLPLNALAKNGHQKTQRSHISHC
ncbi:hypothetical protein [Bartonella tribocorum]|uniref:Uncharacterized protein n=1 Tax=Bartonella tribocorum TaxID=85701 RepID=A0A2M6UU65_9HYPH|nr:hypothetical protein [Bartonella tribocorum]PIT69748.1 hypothetical protein CEV08_05595 [Bartonella tribocorum]